MKVNQYNLNKILHNLTKGAGQGQNSKVIKKERFTAGIAFANRAKTMYWSVFANEVKQSHLLLSVRLPRPLRALAMTERTVGKIATGLLRNRAKTSYSVCFSVFSVFQC